MILLGNFFTIQTIHTEGNAVKSILELNPRHPVFEGHFPGRPVVPGVCMMQMVKEMLETAIGRETRLVKAAQMKFLAVIDPNENKLVHLDLKYEEKDGRGIEVVSSIYSNTTVHFKFQGLLVSGHFRGQTP